MHGYSNFGAKRDQDSFDAYVQTKVNNAYVTCYDKLEIKIAN